MKITKSRIKQLIKEAIIKEFKDTNGLDGIDNIGLGGINLPPGDDDDIPGGGGDPGEPEWSGPESFWIYELNQDQTPSNRKIYLSKSIFQRIMEIFYLLQERSESFSEEYFKRQKAGQDISPQEREEHKAGDRVILESLWQIDKELGGNLIAINSPVAWFDQKYQIHIHAADSIWEDTMELYTVEILSGHLSEHDFGE